jgi:hypothetical protein
MTDPDARPEPPLTGGGRAIVTGFLDHHRATLEWRCSGLTGE